MTVRKITIYFLVASGTFSHKKREVSLIKKSYELFFLFFTTVADSEGSRYFSEESIGPFRSNTWGLQQPLGTLNICQAMLFRNLIAYRRRQTSLIREVYLGGFDGRRITSKITPHVILNKGTFKEITEIGTQRREIYPVFPYG